MYHFVSTLNSKDCKINGRVNEVPTSRLWLLFRELYKKADKLVGVSKLWVLLVAVLGTISELWSKMFRYFGMHRIHRYVDAAARYNFRHRQGSPRMATTPAAANIMITVHIFLFILFRDWLARQSHSPRTCVICWWFWSTLVQWIKNVLFFHLFLLDKLIVSYDKPNYAYFFSFCKFVQNHLQNAAKGRVERCLVSK